MSQGELYCKKYEVDEVTEAGIEKFWSDLQIWKKWLSSLMGIHEYQKRCIKQHKIIHAVLSQTMLKLNKKSTMISMYPLKPIRTVQHLPYLIESTVLNRINNFVSVVPTTRGLQIGASPFVNVADNFRVERDSIPGVEPPVASLQAWQSSCKLAASDSWVPSNQL